MKILRKSMAGLISAGTILCACPQTYAKTESSGQRILNGAKEVGKYVIPFGTALATGFAIGIGYGMFNNRHNEEREEKKEVKREKPESYGMYTDSVLSDFKFLNSIKKQQRPGKLIAEKNAYDELFKRITAIEWMPGAVNIWPLTIKEVFVPIRTGDKILAIGNLDGDIHKTKEAVTRAVDHITKNNGKVVFLGNIISDTNTENNLECILALAELKDAFSQIMIMKGDQERKFVEDKNKFLNGDKYKKEGINYDQIEKMVYPFIKDGTYDDNMVIINKHIDKSDGNNNNQVLKITTTANENLQNINGETLKVLSPSDMYKYITVE